ncbi:phenoloxidase 2-like [Halictus rubicundus]|uniref:phenoloxidase 2-like n=1 Tax=Halictus rubicundus TaxID=77578 RepID=UPI0040374232
MTDIRSGILCLFDRPAEPVCVPKGEKKVVFDIPADYLSDRYRPVATQIFNRFSDETESKLQVKQITLPDLSFPMQLGRLVPFSLFIPSHRKYAGRLIDIFMGSYYSIRFTLILRITRLRIFVQNKNCLSRLREVYLNKLYLKILGKFLLLCI